MGSPVDNMRLEVAFASTPDATSPTWTDITPWWVMSSQSTINRGRQDELSQVQPGTLSVVLDNTDGRFTAGNASSPYYPNVKLRKQIRVTYREQTVTRTNYSVDPAGTRTAAWSVFAGTTGVAAVSAASGTGPTGGPSTWMRATWTTAATVANAFIMEGSASGANASAVTAGNTDTFSMWFQSSVPGTFQVLVDFRTSAGAFVSSLAGTTVTVAANTWTRISATGTVPATAAFAQVKALQSAGTLFGVGATLDGTGVLVEVASSLGTYFDGASVDGTDGWDYAWTGTANASTSTATPVVYERFRGLVDEWPTAWPDGGSLYVQATVTATDMMKRLAALSPLRGVPAEAILGDADVVAYYPLTEPTGSTYAADLRGGASMTIQQYGTGGVVNFGAGTGPATDSAPAVIFERADGNNGRSLTAQYRPGGFNPTRASWSYEFVFATSTVALQRLVKFFTGTEHVYVGIDSTGHAVLGTWTYGNLPGSQASSAVFADGLTRHARVTLTTASGGATCTLYIDDVSVVSFVVSGWTTTIPNWPHVEVGGDSPAMANATISHLVVTGGAMASHYSAIMTGFAGESSNARIARVAAWAGLPSGLLNLDAGASTSLSHIDSTGRTALDVMQDAADTENGQLFAGRDGRLTFHARTRRYTAAVALTLNAAAEDVGGDLEFRMNDQFLVNDVTATSPGGGRYTTRDSASITDYGLARKTFEVFTTSTTELAGRAGWAVYTNSEPRARCESLSVDMMTNNAIRVTALGVDISSRVAITNLPTGAPAASADLFAEGYTETFSATGWDIRFTTSPADLYQVWQLDTTGSSILGTSTRLAF